MLRTKKQPAYRLHKARNCAVVTINGRNHYLGKYDSPESHEAYAREIAKWRAREGAEPSGANPSAKLTITGLAIAYWEFAQGYYKKGGVPTGQLIVVKPALRGLRQLYGNTLATDFGPLALQALQQHWMDAGLSRTYINGHTRRLKLMFRWAASRQLVPASVHQALATVFNLKKGRCAAREPDPVGPVADEVVDAALAQLSPTVADMVRFQRLTGCRPNEVCIIRPCDVDRGDDVWLYRPESHKTEHTGHERVICVGPRAQAVLLPYLLREAAAYCFSPAESEAHRKAEMREARQSKVQPSQVDRRVANPQRRPGDHYDRYSYRTAIHRACDRAFGDVRGPVTWEALTTLAKSGALSPRDMIRRATRSRWKRAVNARGLFAGQCDLNKMAADKSVADWFFKAASPRWSPNQLRHSAATELRRRYGIEAAQLVLGHAKVNTTEIYAERDIAKAVSIMREVG